MIIATLLRNEWIKARRALPFLIALLTLAGLTTLFFLSRHNASQRPRARTAFALPSAWNTILGESTFFTCFFMGTFVVLLVANEFTWRTARQNVIDGLSKEAWLAGKLLLVPLLALVVLLVVVGSGAIVASLGNDPPRTQPLVSITHVRQMAGYFLSLVGFGAFAFLIATGVRSAGPALGLFFGYFFVAENLIRAFLNEIVGPVARVGRYLPGAIFSELLDRRIWNSELATALARSRPTQTVVTPLEPSVIIALAVAYTALFLALSWLLHRKRDL
jgi:ABC-type transport system involved in multi-copper enzyme maturation permease subunit